MGYFDALTSRYFKTGPDGRQLFFPWGVLGRGYLLGSERDYDQLRQRLKIYAIVALVAIVGPAALQIPMASIVIAVLLVAFYFIWVSYLLRGLQASDEKLSWRESITSQAHAHSAVALWSLQVVSLGFVGIGVFILVVEPGKWLKALAAVVFFGLCAAVFAFMLVLRSRRTAR